jgi:hypothetical protein
MDILEDLVLQPETLNDVEKSYLGKAANGSPLHEL